MAMQHQSNKIAVGIVQKSYLNIKWYISFISYILNGILNNFHHNMNMNDSKKKSFDTFLHFFSTQIHLIVVFMLRIHVQVYIICVFEQQLLKIANQTIRSTPVWPLIGIRVPTIKHYVIQLSLTMFWHLQSVSVIHVLDDLFCSHPNIWR